MRHPRLLIALLVPATVLVDLVVWSIALEAFFCQPTTHGESLAHLVLQSLILPQVQLLAIWLVFGGKSVSWRLLAVALAIAIWVRLVAAATDMSGVPTGLFETLWTVYLLLHAIVLAATLTIGRLAGVRIATPAAVSGTKHAANSPSGIQFSLGDLLSWMTASALALGVLPYAMDYGMAPATIPRYLGGPANWLRIAAITGLGTGVALAALWTALGTERPRRRIATLFVALFAQAAVLFALHIPGLMHQVLVVCFVQTAWILASLAVVRVAGFRLVWRRKAASSRH